MWQISLFHSVFLWEVNQSDDLHILAQEFSAFYLKWLITFYQTVHIRFRLTCFLKTAVFQKSPVVLYFLSMVSLTCHPKCINPPPLDWPPPSLDVRARTETWYENGPLLPLPRTVSSRVPSSSWRVLWQDAWAKISYRQVCMNAYERCTPTTMPRQRRETKEKNYIPRKT